MPIVGIIDGNILDTDIQHIVQQCNCNTVKSHGLSQSIATKFPWADVYKQRVSIGNRNAAIVPDTPGTIKVLSNGNRHIVCLFAQWAPGKPGRFQRFYPNTYQDTMLHRELWFQQCLDELDSLQLPLVAVPHGIGCGLAGGRWEQYNKMLQSTKTPITLYRYTEPS